MTFALVVIGLIAGILSGMFGIGGGLIIVPSLVAFLGYETKQAIGTSLGVIILPVGLLGLLTHYKAGNVNFKASLLIAMGLFFGSVIGAHLVVGLPKDVVNKLFAVFLVLVAVKMFIGK